MKKNWKLVSLALIMVWFVQLSCSRSDQKNLCEMEGYIWHEATEFQKAYCEKRKQPVPQPDGGSEGQAPQAEGGSEGQPPAPQVQPGATASGGGATPIPASAQSCNATGYIHPQIEIVKDVQEQYYRECHYKLTLFNVHSEGVWIVRHTNVSVHSSATNTEDSYWYSDLKFPGQSWEYMFRSNYYTNGQTSREGVDMIAGVYNRPDCLWLLTSDEVAVIGQPLEWACAP